MIFAPTFSLSFIKMKFGTWVKPLCDIGSAPTIRIVFSRSFNSFDLNFARSLMLSIAQFYHITGWQKINLSRLVLVKAALIWVRSLRRYDFRLYPRFFRCLFLRLGRGQEGLIRLPAMMQKIAFKMPDITRLGM